MTRVERGNVVLRVEDDEVQHYLQLGYNVTDDNGKVITASIPNDVGTLQKFYLEHTTRITELENQVAELTQKLATKKSVPQTESKEPTQQSKPKTSTKKASK